MGNIHFSVITVISQLNCSLHLVKNKSLGEINLRQGSHEGQIGSVSNTMVAFSPEDSLHSSSRHISEN